MRILTILLTLLAFAPKTFAAGSCGGSIEVKQKFSNAATADTFVVEAFGKDCMSARVLIYMKAADASWHPLFVGELENFSGSGSGLTPAGLPDVLKEIASRIEPGDKFQRETWAQLQKAGTQPGGAPWRGTPLARAEYERIFKQRTRTITVPTDAVRGKLIAWDGSGDMGRPVDFVYYGD